MAPDSAEVGGRRFTILRTLGEGSFGSVYLAEMEGAGGFKKRVALKLLNQSWEPGSDAARRLRDEARLLGRLDHARIVRVDDLVLLDGRWGLVMEYVSGADMERIFAWSEATGSPISPRAVAELGAAVAEALDVAWNAPGEDGAPLRVVHRDIKPSNVRLSEAGKVKVLDFGVALAAFSGREARTERVRYGSLGYMAPERLLGEPDTPAGDVYALGVMLYELVTAKLYGRSELGIDQQLAQVHAARDAMVARAGDTALVTLVESMLAYAPDDRPTAAELAETLQLTADTLGGTDLAELARAVLPQLPPPGSDDALRGRVLQESGARSSGSGALVSSATLVLDPNAPAPVRPPPPSPGLPIAAILGGLAVVLALGAGGYLVLRAEEAASVAAAPATAGAAATAPTAEPTPAEPAPAPEPAPAAEPTPAAEPAADASAAAPSRPRAPGTAPKTPATDTRPARPRAERDAAGAGGAGSGGTAATTEPAAPASEPAASSARLRAAKFTLTGAQGLRVTCGDVTGTGATSALLRDFPAGDCTVAAAGHTTRVRLTEPRGVACAVEGDSLACR